VASTYVADSWRLDITSVNGGCGPVTQYRLTDGGMLVYAGPDLIRVQMILEDDWMSMTDLEPVDGNTGTPAAG
jgi:hypothetical protein